MKYNLILPREMGVELSVTQWAMGIHNGEYPLVIKRGNEQSPIYRYL